MTLKVNTPVTLPDGRSGRVLQSIVGKPDTVLVLIGTRAVEVKISELRQ